MLKQFFIFLHIDLTYLPIKYICPGVLQHHENLDPLRSRLLPLFLECFVTCRVTRHSFNQSRVYERTVIRGSS